MFSAFVALIHITRKKLRFFTRPVPDLFSFFRLFVQWVKKMIISTDVSRIQTQIFRVIG